MAIATTCQTAMRPLAVRSASASAADASTTCAPSMTVRRLARSATAPPKRPSASIGRLPQKLIVPSSEARRVRS